MSNEEKSIMAYSEGGRPMVFAKQPGDTPPVGQVKVVTRDDYSRYFLSGDVIENPNDFFGDSAALSDVIEQTDHMDETDPILAGLIQIRKTTLLAMPREIVGDEGPVTDFVRANFRGIKNMHSKIYQMLDCFKVGCSMAEMVWHPRDNQWWIADLLLRKQTKFSFKKKKGFQPDGDYTDELRAKGDGYRNSGKKLPKNKFLVTTYDERYGNRWGMSLYHSLYWYWFIKRNILNFWQIFMENYVTPIVVAKGTITDANVAARVDAFIQDIKNRMGIRIPDTLALEFIQAEQEGAKTYIDATRYFDKVMNFMILGQVGSLDSGTVGSFARDKVRDNVTRTDIVGCDVSMIESVFNDYMIPPLVDYNFANVTKYPKYRIVTGQATDVEVMLKVIRLAMELKLPLTEKFIYESFGMKQPEKGEDLIQYPEVASGIGSNFSLVASTNRHEGITAKYYRDLEKDKKSIS